MFELDARRILPVQKGYRNQSYAIKLSNDELANLILYKIEPNILTTIANANAVSNFLADKGMSVRQTLDSRIVCLSTDKTKRYGALYNYLPGQTIPWEAYTMRHIKLLGKTMSDMHALLAKFEGDLTEIAFDSLALNHRMQTYFTDPNVMGALWAKLNLKIRHTNFQPLLHICQKLPDQQALHMDFVRGNVLFETVDNGLTISGILDFEKTGRGHVVFDIARTLAFLLVDCKYKDETKVRKYFLQSGYSKRGASPYATLVVKQHDLLEDLLDFFLVHDFYKFLRHNPYEFLPQNEHFIRTRDLLLRRHILEWDETMER
ncbi:MAG TPA: phosphotransferase [Patescibacteria group bacterium]|nr:phosphotransferase [Patescibacteria group bacterium]